MSGGWDFRGLSEEPNKPFKRDEVLTPSEEFKRRVSPIFKSEQQLHTSVLYGSKASSEDFRDDFDHKLPNFSLPFAILNDNVKLQTTHSIKSQEFVDNLVMELAKTCYPGNHDTKTEMGLKMLLQAVASKDIYVTAVEKYLKKADWKQCCYSVRFLTFILFLASQNPKVDSTVLLNTILQEKAMEISRKQVQTDVEHILFYVDYYMQFYAQAKQHVPDFIKSTMFAILFKLKEKDVSVGHAKQRSSNLTDKSRERYQELLRFLSLYTYSTSSVQTFSQLIVMINNLNFARLPADLVEVLDRAVVRYDAVDDKLLKVIASDLFAQTKIRSQAANELLRREESTKKAAVYQAAPQNRPVKQQAVVKLQPKKRRTAHPAFQLFVILSLLYALACIAIEPTDATVSLLSDVYGTMKTQAKWLLKQYRRGYNDGLQ